MESAYKWFNITWLGSGSKVGSHCKEKKKQFISYFASV